MMGDRLDAAKRGFGLQEIRATADRNLATPTESTPRPGSQVPSLSTSRLKPVVSHAQGASIETYVTTSGQPNDDPFAREGLALVWRLVGGAYQGYSGPGWLHSMDQIATSFIFSAKGYDSHDIVTVPSSQIAVAITGKINQTNSILEAKILNPADWATWTTVEIENFVTGDGTAQFDSGMCVLPDDRLLVIRLIDDKNNVSQWRVWTSTDAGATWSIWSNRPFAAITANLGSFFSSRVRMAAAGDEVLLCRTQAAGPAFVQYASKSVGATFGQVGSDWTVNPPEQISIAALKSGAFGMIYTALGAFLFRRIGSAFESFETALSVTVQAGKVSAASAIWVDEVGTVWVSLASDGVRLYFSQDEGDTWIPFTSVSVGAGFPFGADPVEFGDINTEYEPDAATVTTGRTIMVGNSTDGGGSGDEPDGMVWAVQLGGHFNIEFQGWHDSGGGGTDGLTWFPIEKPTTVAPWVETTTGGTATLIAPGLMQVVTAASTFYWTATADTNARDIVFEIDIDMQSAGSLTSTLAGAEVFLGDGVNRTEIEINFTSTQYSVFDRNATASRGTFTPAAGRVQVLVYHTWNGGTPTVSTWHRTAGADLWVAGAVAVSATTVANVAPSRFSWGNAVSGSETVNWRLAAWTWHDTDGQLAIHETAATMRGKAINPLPSALPVAVGDGGRAAFLSAISGPGIVAETHTIATEHDFPKEAFAVDESPSSTVKHRTTDLTETVIAEYSPNEDGEFSTNPGNTTLFLYAEGINWRIARLEGSTDGTWAAPVVIGTFDAAIGTSIPYVFFGQDALEVDPAGSGVHARYAWNNELTGGTVELPGGLFEYRRIRRNTEGAFNADSVTRQARLWLEGVTGSEPASPNTMQVWAPRGVAFFHNVGAFKRFRAVIPAQGSADSYFETGRLMFGAVHPAGREWSKGWSITESLNNRTRSEPDGSRRVKRQGPTLRDLVVAWPDAVAMTGLHGGNPNYLAADTGGPLAAEDDVAYWLGGILEYTQSSRWPVLAIAEIPDTDVTITDRSLFLCGHIVSSASFNHVHGVAGATELGRVQNIKIEELP